MKTPRINLVAAAGLSLLASSVPGSGHADVSVADKLVATQLFKEGRALLEQGQVAQACPKLQESQRLDPGGGTLLNLALCHERQNRAATAWEEFTEALGVAKRDNLPQRIEFARDHIAELEPLLSRLVVQVPAAADLPDLEIHRDGSPLGRAAWGSSLPVDPGDHLIEVTAPGKISWKESIVAGPKADTKIVVVPVLQDALVQDDAQTGVAPAGRGPVATAPQESSRARSVTPNNGDSSQNGSASQGGGAAPAWIALGLGAAATGIGTYFIIRAIAQKNDADRGCPENLCSAQGASDNSDAIKSANFATAGFVVGGLGLGLGFVLFVARAAGSHAAEPAVKPTESALATVASGLSVSPSGAEVRFSSRW
jgi:hypothetical protein